MVPATQRRQRIAQMRKLETRAGREPSRLRRLRQSTRSQCVRKASLLLRPMKVWRRRRQSPRPSRQSRSTPWHDLRNPRPPHTKMQPGRKRSPSRGPKRSPNRKLPSQQNLNTRLHDPRRPSRLLRLMKVWPNRNPRRLIRQELSMRKRRGRRVSLLQHTLPPRREPNIKARRNRRASQRLRRKKKSLRGRCYMTGASLEQRTPYILFEGVIYQAARFGGRVPNSSIRSRKRALRKRMSSSVP